MSVSSAPGGPNQRYTLDPKDIELNASRLSAFSHNSSASGIVLGGVEYPVGSRVGKSKQFIIGDPHSFDPSKSFESVRSSNGSTFNSKKDLVETEPIEDKGYGFEDWNWQIIRLCCFIGLIAVMVILFAVTVGVAVEHQMSCDSPYKWWQGAVIYSIPVAYFRDTDNNEVGDLDGLDEKLDYIEYMGPKVISLNHVLASEAPYFERYTSFTDVDTRVGDNAELTRIIKRAQNELEAKVLLEISPYSTSKRHAWFEDSRQDSGSYQSPYELFYVWRSEPDHSLNGQWERDQFRNQYFYHHNDSLRPVLHWSTHLVREEFGDVLKEWLDRGVDGFIIRDMHLMFAYRNSDILTAVQDWRDLLDKESKNDKRKILVVEDKFMKKIARENSELVDNFRRNVDLIEVELNYVSSDVTRHFQDQVERGLSMVEKDNDPWICWKLDGLISSLPLRRTTMQMLTLMLPGTPMLIAGQETGNLYMEEEFNQITPPLPMLWKLDDMFPYHPGTYPQNLTTIKALRQVIKERQDAITLRSDSIRGESEGGNKKFNYKFRELDSRWMLLERTYKRKNAYYYAGNYHEDDLEKDMSFISPEGKIISDNFDKYKDKKNLMDVKLHQAHGIVFMVTY